MSNSSKPPISMIIVFQVKILGWPTKIQRHSIGIFNNDKGGRNTGFGKRMGTDCMLILILLYWFCTFRLWVILYKALANSDCMKCLKTSIQTCLGMYVVYIYFLNQENAKMLLRSCLIRGELRYIWLHPHQPNFLLIFCWHPWYHILFLD